MACPYPHPHSAFLIWYVSCCRPYAPVRLTACSDWLLQSRRMSSHDICIPAINRRPYCKRHAAYARQPKATQNSPVQSPSVRRRRVKMNENESGHENENGHRFTKTEARHFLAAAPPPLAHYAGALASPSPHSKPSTIRPVRACFSPSELASSAVHSETAHP